MRQFYPPIQPWKCDRCAATKRVCHGVAGMACISCKSTKVRCMLATHGRVSKVMEGGPVMRPLKSWAKGREPELEPKIVEVMQLSRKGKEKETGGKEKKDKGKEKEKQKELGQGKKKDALYIIVPLMPPWKCKHTPSVARS